MTGQETIQTPADRPASTDGSALLAVEGLRVEFRMRSGTLVANDSVSYSVDRGETLAILGESGSGKSVSAQAIMGIIDSPPGFITDGSIRYAGQELLDMPERQRRRIRGNHVAMIFQDALSALNPVFTVGFQIAEMFRVHEGMSRRAAYDRTVELLDMVKIPDAKARLRNYPHEFSGGMRQRVMIAMALALQPDVLIADEPTTALDVTVQAQVMSLLAELQADTGMGLILITHDLGVVAEVADRVAVMYAGRIVETGTIGEIFTDPRHPYTLGLMESLPKLGGGQQRLTPIPGSPPDLTRRPSGCAFHPRCRLARPECTTNDPPLYDLDTPGRSSACHFHQEVTIGRR